MILSTIASTASNASTTSITIIITFHTGVAMDTGYDPRTIRRVELGECCPSAEFMFEMSDYFGVPIEEIFALDKSTESV